jgi:hypothetical protein
MKTTRSIDFDAPATLAQLRQFVADTQDMSPDSVLAARIGFGKSGAGSGSKLTQLIVADNGSATDWRDGHVSGVPR